ncbi:MAG TPA: hypothetical protein QGG32_11935 [Rhodospirillales bacterium]|jgi:hypothetical protein|nr:hypothetical protein [Rhodospirillales bacterium]
MSIAAAVVTFVEITDRPPFAQLAHVGFTLDRTDDGRGLVTWCQSHRRVEGKTKKYGGDRRSS